MITYKLLADRHQRILDEHQEIYITCRWGDWTEYYVLIKPANVAHVLSIDIDDLAALVPTETDIRYRILFGHRSRTQSFSHIEVKIGHDDWTPIEMTDAWHLIECDADERTKQYINSLLPTEELLALDKALLDFQQKLLSQIPEP